MRMETVTEYRRMETVTEYGECDSPQFFGQCLDKKHFVFQHSCSHDRAFTSQSDASYPLYV